MSTQTITIEKINDDYEHIQYNQHLRLIHSINDDMFQAQSILNACNSNKQFRHWINRESSKEIVNELAKISSGRKLPVDFGDEKALNIPGIYEIRMNEANGLRGIYVHRLLVNHIAMWCSPKYSLYIMKLLDSTFAEERNKLMNKIEEQQPRLVPDKHQNDYFYLCWKEDMPNNAERVILHQVRRQNRTFNRIKSHHDNENENFYYQPNLPISMAVAKDIKDIIRKNFNGNEYQIRTYDIIINKSCLEQLHTLIQTYFESFQK